MGSGFTAKCKKCGFEFDVMAGVGFMYPEIYSEVLEDIKAGKLGEEIKLFFETHSNAAINAERVVLQCEDCGNLETEKDYSVFIPQNEDVDCSERKGKWSIAFPAEGYKFVAPWELNEKYIKVIEYPHKCSKCSGKMKVFSEDELNNIHCPECGGEMENVGNIFWD